MTDKFGNKKSRKQRRNDALSLPLSEIALTPYKSRVTIEFFLFKPYRDEEKLVFSHLAKYGRFPRINLRACLFPIKPDDNGYMRLSFRKGRYIILRTEREKTRKERMADAREQAELRSRAEAELAAEHGQEEFLSWPTKVRELRVSKRQKLLDEARKKEIRENTNWPELWRASLTPPDYYDEEVKKRRHAERERRRELRARAVIGDISSDSDHSDRSVHECHKTKQPKHCTNFRYCGYYSVWAEKLLRVDHLGWEGWETNDVTPKDPFAAVRHKMFVAAYNQLKSEHTLPYSSSRPRVPPGLKWDKGRFDIYSPECIQRFNADFEQTFCDEHITARDLIKFQDDRSLESSTSVSTE